MDDYHRYLSGLAMFNFCRVCQSCKGATDSEQFPLYVCLKPFSLTGGLSDFCSVANGVGFE